MREKIKADEASIVESISTRNRMLKASMPKESPLPETETTGEAERLPETVAEPVKEKEASREEPKRKRSKAQSDTGDYETLFIKAAATTTRSGKAVYIRKEFHDRITRIIQNIGYNELSLFSYIDNVLEHHFNIYQEDISELYRKRRPDDIF